MLRRLQSDISVVFERDPAARSAWEIFFCYPGLHALWFYRVSHWLWNRRLYFAGRFVSHVGRWLTGIEIHPGATIGPGLFIDHGMGVVIGETAEIGEQVTIYHGVTLGGVSWRKEKRHPTIGNHVVIGAGAKVLGPITIGDYTRIGANSVVVKDVLPNSVVVGVPGRVRMHETLRYRDTKHEDLEHNELHDATMERVQELSRRLSRVEAELGSVHGSLAEEEAMVGNGYQGPWGI